MFLNQNNTPTMSPQFAKGAIQVAPVLQGVDVLWKAATPVILGWTWLLTRNSWQNSYNVYTTVEGKITLVCRRNLSLHLHLHQGMLLVCMINVFCRKRICLLSITGGHRRQNGHLRLMPALLQKLFNLLLYQYLLYYWQYFIVGQKWISNLMTHFEVFEYFNIFTGAISW